MPKPAQPITFLGWLEDISKVPGKIPPETFAVYKKKTKAGYFLLKVESSTSEGTPTAFLSSFTEGGESIKDIKGVTTVLSLEDFKNKPFETIKKIGTSTVEDIMNIDEVAGDRLASTIESLTTGDIRPTTLEPDSLIVKALNLKVANKQLTKITDSSRLVDETTGKSSIQLAGSPIAGYEHFNAFKEDRKIVEESNPAHATIALTDKTKNFKPYLSLAGSLSAMAGYSDSTSTRTKYYKEALKHSRRALMSELGVDLEAVLPYQYGKGLRNGKLAEEISHSYNTYGEKWNQNLQNLLDDPNRITNALQIPLSNWQSFSPDTQEYLRQAVRSEAYSNEAFNEKSVNFLSAGAISKDAAEVYVTNPFIQELHSDDFLIRAATKKGKPGEKRFTSIEGRETLAREIETQMRADATLQKIVADAVNNKPTSEAVKISNRIDSLSRTSNIANNLFFASTTEEMLDQLEQGKFLTAGIINSRLFGLFPLWKVATGATGEYTTAIDKYVSKFQNSKLVNQNGVTKLLNPKYLKDDFIGKQFGLVFEGDLADIDKVAAPFTGIGKRLVRHSKSFVDWDEPTAPNLPKKWHQTWIDSREVTGLFGKKDSKPMSTFLEKMWGPNGNLLDTLGIQGVDFTDRADLFSDKTKLLRFLENIKSAATDRVNGVVPTSVTRFHQFADYFDLDQPDKYQAFVTQLKNFQFAPTERWAMNNFLEEMWGPNGKLLNDFGILGVDFIDRADLFSDKTKLLGFFNNLKNAAKDRVNGVTPTSVTRFHRLADHFSLSSLDNYQAFTDQLDKFEQIAVPFLFDKMRLQGLTDANRGHFIDSIIKQGKVNELINPYMGLMNTYNRYVNGLNSFLYKQVIRGGYTGSNALIRAGMYISAPLRSLLEAAGFSDTLLISEQIQQKLLISQYLNKMGQGYINKGMGIGNVASGAKSWLRASTILAKSPAGRAILRGFGFLLKGFAGMATGLIGWVVASAGEMAFKTLKNIITMNFDRAMAELREDAIRKANAVKKLVFGIVFGIFGCAFIPILLILIVVGGMFAPFEEMGGGAYGDIVESRNLKVDKTAVLSGTTITYTITIKNISEDENGVNLPAEISSFVDNTTYSGSCSSGMGLVTLAPTSDRGKFWVNGNVRLPTIEDLPKTKLEPDESITLSFELRDININDASTYTNIIDVESVGESSRSSTASAATQIKEGGCNECPTGWPTRNGIITQGPDWEYTHGGAEAIDVGGVGSGTPVYATFNGTAHLYADCGSVATCPYGNRVELESPLGFSAVYAHLSDFSLSSTQYVETGTKLGETGNTGNSDAAHLHYEFINITQCIPGYPVSMRNISGQSYVPQTVPSLCKSCISW